LHLGPWPDFTEQRSGEGIVGEKVEETEVDLWVSLLRGEEVRGGGSTCADGQ